MGGPRGRPVPQGVLGLLCRYFHGRRDRLSLRRQPGGNRLPAAKHGGRPSLGRWGRQHQVGEALEEQLEGDLELEPDEGSTDTVVTTVAEGEVGPDRAVDPVYFELLTRFCQVRGRVEQGGIRLADPGRGTLEFPALRAGRPVLLQGLLGEKQVRSWRDEHRTRPLDEGPWG